VKDDLRITQQAHNAKMKPIVENGFFKPPTYNMGVQNLEKIKSGIKCDWFGVTFPITDHVLEGTDTLIKLVTHKHNERVHGVRARSGFDYGYDLGIGRMDYRVSSEPKYMSIQLTGSDLTDLRKLGESDKKIARACLDHRGKASRIDIALDVYIEPKKAIGELWQCYLSGGLVSYSKKVRSIIDENGGQTINLGSRTSEVYVRIYNKTVEAGLDYDLVRIEVELKDKSAQLGLAQIASGFIGVGSWFNKFNFNGVEWWSEAISSMDLTVPAKEDKKVKANENWLFGQVLPALERIMSEDTDLYIRFLNEAIGVMDKNPKRKQVVGVSDFKTKIDELLLVRQNEGGTSD
jgi:hypothetical protein